MKIRVEKCWSGGDSFSRRVTILTGPHKGERETFQLDENETDRATATRIRDRLVRDYGANRNSIKTV